MRSSRRGIDDYIVAAGPITAELRRAYEEYVRA
jgi:hypothetical protein